MFWIRREQIFNGQEVYSALYFLVYFNQVFKTPPSLIECIVCMHHSIILYYIWFLPPKCGYLLMKTLEGQND